MRDEALHDVLEAWVGALRVYAVHVFGDVGGGEILEDGDRGLRALVRHVWMLESIGTIRKEVRDVEG